MPHLTIGKLAERTGVSTDTLRYYEKMQLLAPGERTASGYRLYHYDAVRVVRFIRGAKALHFSLQEIRSLLALSVDDRRRCLHVLKRTEAKIREAQARIADLQEIRHVLASLLEGQGQAGSPSVIDRLRHTTRLLSLSAAALLSCLPDAALACAERCLPEDAAIRVEEPLKRSRLQPVCL